MSEMTLLFLIRKLILLTRTVLLDPTDNYRVLRSVKTHSHVNVWL